MLIFAFGIDIILVIFGAGIIGRTIIKLPQQIKSVKYDGATLQAAIIFPFWLASLVIFFILM